MRLIHPNTTFVGRSYSVEDWRVMISSFGIISRVIMCSFPKQVLCTTDYNGSHDSEIKMT